MHFKPSWNVVLYSKLVLILNKHNFFVSQEGEEISSQILSHTKHLEPRLFPGCSDKLPSALCSPPTGLIMFPTCQFRISTSILMRRVVACKLSCPLSWNGWLWAWNRQGDLFPGITKVICIWRLPLFLVWFMHVMVTLIQYIQYHNPFHEWLIVAWSHSGSHWQRAVAVLFIWP